jgi:hypothetical protein
MHLEPLEKRPVAIDEAEHDRDGHCAKPAIGQHLADRFVLREHAVDELPLIASAHQEVVGAGPQETATSLDSDATAVPGCSAPR